LKEVIAKFLFYTLASIGIIFLYIKYIESKSIFFPEKSIDSTPAAAGLKFEQVEILSSDNLKLGGWFITHPQSTKTILFFHGNAGNISNRLDKIALIHKIKANIFIINYRGYGNSQGKPSEKGIYLDGQAAYDYLVNQRSIKPQSIILYGESLGGTVAVDLASKQEVGGLILEGTFSSGKDIGHRLYPFLPKFILPNLFDSLTKISNISAPKLFMHSKEDAVVAFDLGKKLYDASPEPKKFITLKGAHNSMFIDSQSQYLKALSDFIKSLS